MKPKKRPLLKDLKPLKKGAEHWLDTVLTLERLEEQADAYNVTVQKLCQHLGIAVPGDYVSQTIPKGPVLTHAFRTPYGQSLADWLGAYLVVQKASVKIKREPRRLVPKTPETPPTDIYGAGFRNAIGTRLQEREETYSQHLAVRREELIELVREGDLMMDKRTKTSRRARGQYGR